MEIIWPLLILQALICGFLSMTLAEHKGHSTGAWFAVGFFCGIFGLIAAAGLPTKQALQPSRGLLKKCPDCAESLRREALVCKFCGKKFTKDQVVADLVETLQEKSLANKLLVLDALSAIKDDSVIPHIVKLIETIPIQYESDANFQLLNKAVQIVIGIGSQNISAEFASILKKTKSVVKAKRLVEALDSMQNPDSISVLIDVAIPQLERLAKEGVGLDRTLAKKTIKTIKSSTST